MIPKQLLLLFFLILIFAILILISLDIDYLSRLISHEELPYAKSSFHIDVMEINRQINLNVQSKITIDKLIQLCPVNAISKPNDSQEGMIISETLCLGYSCRECLRLVLLNQFNTEIK
ncbi:MAG: hypothetical protein ACFFC6_17780 [Promethearchaeota archaeon]